MEDASKGAGTEPAGVPELRARVVELEALVVELMATIAELRVRLARNPRNSSRPPGSQGLQKPPPRPTRNPSGRKPGGQEGSEGHHLAQRDVPDEVRVLPAGACEGCGASLEGAPVVQGSVQRRQVLDLPELPRLGCVEWRGCRRRCGCGRESCPVFPTEAKAAVSYGPRIRALGIYLVCYQHLPFERAGELLGDWLGAPVSVGSLQAFIEQGTQGLEGFLAQITGQLANAPVLHVDETGARVAGKTAWVFTAGTVLLTLYSEHGKRNRQGAEKTGVLAGFTGTMVHDGWKPYQAYTQARHGLCGAHHLRELTAAEEAGQAWAGQMSILLLDAHQAAKDARASGESALPADALSDYHDWYRQIITAAYAENPGLAEKVARRKKRTDAQNLLLRLDERQAEAMRFTTDLTVPFTNNQAENDLRMIKVHQKVSGCWRTTDGLARFLDIRSYLCTARKHGVNLLTALTDLAAGRPWLPPPQPT